MLEVRSLHYSVYYMDIMISVSCWYEGFYMNVIVYPDFKENVIPP